MVRVLVSAGAPFSLVRNLQMHITWQLPELFTHSFTALQIADSIHFRTPTHMLFPSLLLSIQSFPFEPVFVRGKEPK
jgi:hypothetical protein